ncbi:unnamed protein product [Ostreobium quekettii]|uniref:Uncharacterized protein n=1 Tax=Ostreobium quekettii TaxID=121088 RepID=A0A8S1ITF3_9CHLO|nr:unnamed protein product [Ostreobium quekettii]
MFRAHAAETVPDAALEAVRVDVDAFLLSLPLGTDRASAEVEEAVAHRLVAAEISGIKLQKKIAQWWGLKKSKRRRIKLSYSARRIHRVSFWHRVQVATELYHVAEDRQLKIDRLQACARKDGKEGGAGAQACRANREMQMVPGGGPGGPPRSEAIAATGASFWPREGDGGEVKAVLMQQHGELDVLKKEVQYLKSQMQRGSVGKKDTETGCVAVCSLAVLK